MLSFNSLFGGGAALRTRPIWTGTDRLLPSIVAGQVRPYKLMGATSPAGVVLTSIAHNGAVYACAKAANGDIHTSTDLTTYTLRRTAGAAVDQIVALGSTFFAKVNMTGSYLLQRSTDNAVTWGAGLVIGSNDFLSVAGGIAYCFGATGKAFKTYNPGDGTWTARNFFQTSTALWGPMLHNGSVWCTASFSSNLEQCFAEVSTDGTTFAASTGFAAALARMPIQGKCMFVVGQRFVVIGFDSSGGFSTMYSEDGHNWTQGARIPNMSGGRPIFSLSARGGLVIDGVLHVNVAFAVVTPTANQYAGAILSTADGVDWRTLPDYKVFTTFDASVDLGRRVGTPSMLIGGTVLETDVVNGKELFYEL